MTTLSAHPTRAKWHPGASGNTWTALSHGLPAEDFYGGVYREGMASDSLDPADIYFGTNNGKVFNSADEGETWRLLADNLPPVFSAAAEIQ